MPTSDFFFDAVDSLNKDPSAPYFLLQGRDGEARARFAVNIPSKETLDTIREAVFRLLDEHEHDNGWT